MKYGYNSGGVWKVSEGRKPTEVYTRWISMMARCYNPNHKAYKTYGALGDHVCDDWHDFQVFAQWFDENKVDGWSMDKDLSGGSVYSPSTVAFVPEQVNQLLKFYNDVNTGVGKSTNTWFVKTTNADSQPHYMGKFTSREAAVDYYQGYIRLKMVALIRKYSIPAATAARLLSL